MSNVVGRSGTIAVCVVLAATIASAQPAPEQTERVEALWGEEGATLRSLAQAARGESRGEALLRLGEWERQSAERLRRASEDGPPRDDEIAAHLDAAERAFSEAVPLVNARRLPQTLFSLGDLRRTRGDTEGAREPLERLVAEFSAHPLAIDAAVALGDDAFDDARLADAMDRYRYAAKNAPTDGARAYARYKLAWCHLNLSEYAEARALFHEAIRLTSGENAVLSLANEARRDLVLTLARDPDMPAPEAYAEILELVEPDRARRYAFAYSQLIAEAGRDDEAAALLPRLEPGAPSVDAIRILTLQLEIATRRREMDTIARASRTLADTVRLDTSGRRELGDEDRERAERALRVVAVTLHGEGRAAASERVQEHALAAYENYFHAFDEAPAAYELHHHAGELLLSLERPAEAERHYTASLLWDVERVERGEKPGPWLHKSAHGAVLAAQDAMPPAPEAKPADHSDEAGKEAPPEPKPLDPAEEIFVAACDRYLQVLSTGAEAVEVRYQRALVLLRRDHLDEASAALAKIALEHPDSEPATYSARLSLDALRRLGRYDELASLAGDLLKRRPLAHEIGDELSDVREGALVAAAARAADQEHHSEAVQRYLEFAEAFPRSQRLDKALYNAAVSLAEQGSLARAIEVRGQLLQRVPNSPLVPRASERQLADLVLLGRFGEALDLAREVASADRSKKQGAVKLHDAIVLAEAAGKPDVADELRREYVKRFPHATDAMTHALALADRARGCTSAKNAYDKALAISPDRAWRTIALARSARRLEKCGDMERARYRASEAAALGPKLPADRGEALDASADAALLMARPLIEKFAAVPLREPYERLLPRKLEALKRLDDSLAKVVARGRAAPAVCALVESGVAYADLARGLSQARAPRGFTEEQQMLFEEKLAEQAQPLFDRAKTALMESIARARETGVGPECLTRGRQALAGLWPERFGERQEALVTLAPGVSTATIPAAEVLAKAPDAPAAWLIAARAELAGGHPQAALVLAERIETGDPLHPDASEVRAQALEAMGRHDAALAVWLGLAKAHPERESARRVLADRALANGDLEGAREHLEQLLSVRKEDVGVALNLGVVLRGLGDIELAEKLIRNAWQLAPDRPEPALNLGLLLCNEGGRPQEGVEALEKFLEQGGKPPDARGFDAAFSACRALARGAG